MARVVGSALIEDARQRGRVVFELLPGDIVTDAARETAERLGIRLVEGPLERAPAPRTDGATAARRVLYRRGARWVAPKPQVQPRARRLAKLALVGAGGVGANVAHLAAMADMAEEIALIDIAPGLAAATALDLDHAAGITRARGRAVGGESLGLVAGADVVVVSAGRARGPGMSRADLIEINARVIRRAAEAIAAGAPDAVVIVVTNPVDEMTAEMLRATGFPRERVLGMAGTLDSARFRVALARAAGVEPADVEAMALGAHGPEMVPVASLARIRGRPLAHWLDAETIAACVRDAVTGGGQVVELKKSGSATLAPAHATVELLEHIRGARTGPVPVSVWLEGEYGIAEVVLGVPALLGARGLLEVVELPLALDELAALRAAAEAIRQRLGG